jgi:hypothetical protein
MDLNPAAQTGTGSGTASGTSRSAAAPLTERLRRASFGMVCALLIQYGLGVGVSLFVNVPDKDKGKGTGAAFGNAFSNGPAALAAHAGIGLLLIINVIVVLVLAIRTKTAWAMATSIIGFLSVIGAAFAGAAFVDKGQNSASMTMAVLTGVAIACYVVNLYVLGFRKEND